MRFIATVDGYAGDKEYDSIEEFAKTLANFINSASEGEKINFAVFNISNEKIEKKRMKESDPEPEVEPETEIVEVETENGINDELITSKKKMSYEIGKVKILAALSSDVGFKMFEIREKTGLMKTSLRRYVDRMLGEGLMVDDGGKYFLPPIIVSDKMTYEKGRTIILGVLNDDDGEWLVVSDIRKKTGLASRTSTTYLKKMREDGSVRYDGSGFFKYKRK